MIGAIIQARTGSSRLPNKVLRPVLDKPLLAYLIERLQASRRLDRIIVATTTNQADDAIEALVHQLQIPCIRGSEDDVLSRYYLAASQHRLEHVVRVTADCPLLDPEILDRVVGHYLDRTPGIDYVSNVRPPTYPDGLDVEVFSMRVLSRMHQLADQPYQREHVTTYVAEHPDQFRCENVAHGEDLSRHRWTVDTEEDFQLVRCIIEALYPVTPRFTMQAVLALLTQHPELERLNRHHVRNEGFVLSLERQGLSAETQKTIIQTVLKRSS
ncbi:MAG: glycosyltransferase family protein [Candidatus Omnitrophota bacterium]|nr:glycosyltransferase family protein [Candidatus Omnitrophota bacterium]